VPRPMDAEVVVAAEVVGQETNADFERDELARKGQQRTLSLGQEFPRRREVACGELLEDRHVHLDLGEVLLVFERRAGGGANHVAEVVERAAGHHGVQVHHAHGFAGDHVEHDIVEFRVVVRDALGDSAFRHGTERGSRGPS